MDYVRLSLERPCPVQEANLVALQALHGVSLVEEEQRCSERKESAGSYTPRLWGNVLAGGKPDMRARERAVQG